MAEEKKREGELMAEEGVKEGAEVAAVVLNRKKRF